MKRTNTNTAAQTASKPARKSPFVTVQEKQNRAEFLLLNPENPANRAELIRMVSNAVAYHDSGKIEGLFSLDVACSNSDFCPRMQQCGNPAVICSHCYTKKMFALPRMAHHVTGTILSEMLFTVEELRYVTVPGIYLRIDSDGELINLTHARNVIRLAKAHPETAAITPWTKRPEILDEAIRLEGKPENLICGISSILINRPADPARYWWADFIFTVYTPAGMIEALKRGEHDCNGKKCQHCGFYCYKRHDTSAGPVRVAEALRPAAGMNPERFAEVCALIDAQTLAA